MFPSLMLGARYLCNDRNTQLVAKTKHAQTPASSAELFPRQNLTNYLHISTTVHGVTSQKELSTSPPMYRTFHAEISSRVRHQRAVDVFVTSSLTIYESITFRHSNEILKFEQIGVYIRHNFQPLNWSTSQNLAAELCYNITRSQRCLKNVHYLLVCSSSAFSNLTYPTAMVHCLWHGRNLTLHSRNMLPYRR